LFEVPVRSRHKALTARAWRIPSLYAGGAIVAAIVLPRVESLAVFGAHVSEASALALYSAVASGMIALTAIVFSLAFVMVQFSATAYSPRLVLWVARDPIISHALGVFIATFLYAVSAIAWVGRGRVDVPIASALVVVGLLLASVGFFVALIQRIAQLQIGRMLAFTGEQGRSVVDELYPPMDGAPAVDAFEAPPIASTQTVTYHGRPRTVQAIRVDALVRAAAAAGAVVEVPVAVGDTVMESMPLMCVRVGRLPLEEHVLRRYIELGDERTFEQDPKYALRLLVDIAVKALSPAVNDPTTAVQALDQIGDLLLRLGHRRLEIGAFRDARGAVRVVVPFPTWDDFLLLGFDEIRAYGADSVQVMRRMNALIGDLIASVPPQRRDALVRWQVRLRASIERHFNDPGDRRDASIPDRQGLGISRTRTAA